MKVVIDENIPFIKGIFEPFMKVVYLPGKRIRQEDLTDADCLITRTRTRCDRELLEGTPVRFIASATIGFDHIDTEYCRKAGIRWSNAPGCNSGSVAQYVTAALMVLADRQHFDLRDKTLGIIGVGHVGSKVQRIAEALGMTLLLNDPPRTRAEGQDGFTDLKNLLTRSDIITLHVPLNREGEDRTFHMVDREFLGSLKSGTILINTSRGEVVDESELLRWMIKPAPQSPVTSHESRITSHESRVTSHLSVVLDVWENEPRINRDLLNLTDIATPHIAGYSLDGKFNATRMVVEAVSREFGIDDLPITSHESRITSHESRITSHESLVTLSDYILSTYDILADDRRLRESPESFEEQRNNYPVRREFGAFTIDPFPEGSMGNILKMMGFNYLS